MGVVVEDGTGLATATSWVTRAELIAFAAARGVTIPDAAETDTNLVLAMDWLAAQNYRGEPLKPEQGTPFPRVVYNGDGALAYPSDAVPLALKRSQMLLALATFNGVVLQGITTVGPQVKRKKVGPLEKEFFEGDVPLMAEVGGVRELIAPFLQRGNGIGFSTVRV